MARARAYSDSVESRRRLRLLEHSHHLDQATGLGNRGYCEKRLAQAISFTSRHGQALTLMHLELSGLERLLKEQGHGFAARTLNRIGETLATRIRCEDTVFRTGSERFTFLLPATQPEGAEALQARFLPDLEALGLSVPGDGLHVSARFIIQPVPLHSPNDAAALLELGLADRVGTKEAAATESKDGLAALDLEEALRMLERGDAEQIRPHLSHIRQRLQPLLAMLAEGSATAADRMDVTALASRPER
ncbi:MAG: GGDEF domain-containing protein [Wenzhouxiangella sp.]|nr:MAG: GGDEF domain-containing protein [Wenzhouxiangella sp.]